MDEQVIKRTLITSTKQASKIQRDADIFGCRIIELGIIDTMTVRLVVEGTENDVNDMIEHTR